MNDLKEVFKKMDRQEELMSRLSLAIPEILVIDQWKTYILFLKKCQALLDISLENVKKQNITQEVLISSEKEARFHLFNFFSCAYCIRQAMFEGKNFTKGQKELETAVTQWKKEPIPRIVIAIRNKYQHGSLMEHVLRYTVRTKHDPRGESFSVGYNFEASTWEKVFKELQEVNAKNYLQNILDRNLDSPIAAINSEFIDACISISQKTEEIFNSVFKDDLKVMEDLKKEYDEIEAWFGKRGVCAANLI